LNCAAIFGGTLNDLNLQQNRLFLRQASHQLAENGYCSGLKPLAVRKTVSICLSHNSFAMSLMNKNHSPYRILVVADDTIIALDIESELTRLGYHVLACAANGADALRLATSLLPD
jgi:hypothetical protein